MADFEDHVGDTIRFRFEFGFDISGRTFQLTLRKLTDNSVVATANGDMSEAAAGAVTLTVDDTVTAALASASYRYGVSMVDGGEPSTLEEGLLRLKPRRRGS